MQADSQLKVAQFLFSEDDEAKVRRAYNNSAHDPPVLFHNRQLWFLLQMAILTCRETSQDLEEKETRQTFGGCCLIASDLVARIEQQSLPDLLPGQDLFEWLTAITVPLMEAKDREDMLARAQLFWIDLPTDASLLAAAKRCGLDRGLADAFEAKTGLPLRTFLDLHALLYYGLLQPKSPAGVAPALLDPSSLPKEIPSEQVSAFFAALSQSPDDLAISLLSRPRQSWATDITPLRRAPILEVFEKRYACADLNLLLRTAVEGVFFFLQESYPAGTFRPYFGHLFAHYINHVFSSFLVSQSSLEWTFFPGPKFDNGDEAADGACRWPKTLLLMEYKAGLLTNYQRYGGRQSDTLKGIDDLLIRNPGSGKKGKKGTGQLVDSILKLLRNEPVTSAGVVAKDLLENREILPALVVFDEALANEGVRKRANARLRQQLADEGATPTEHDRVLPLIVLDASDIEILECASGSFVPEELLREYVQVLSRPAPPLGGFANFMSVAHPPDRTWKQGLLQD
jgi:hypothetical protein